MITSTISANDAATRFEKREFVDPRGEVLRYRLLSPSSDSADNEQRYPLVLFLHGAGERGDDNTKQLVHGMSDFASDENRAKYPCYVVAPQCPEEARWVETPWTADEHRMPEQPSTAMRQSLELIDALQKELPIDPDRIYVTGLSMGGFGVWDAVQRHPQLFAAAAPICGGGDVTLARTIAHVPVWAFHGSEDAVVRPERSRDMIAALRKSGGEPKYTEYSGVGHNSWQATYADPEFFAWLFAQRRQR